MNRKNHIWKWMKLNKNPNRNEYSRNRRYRWFTVDWWVHCSCHNVLNRCVCVICWCLCGVRPQTTSRNEESNELDNVFVRAKCVQCSVQTEWHHFLCSRCRICMGTTWSEHTKYAPIPPHTRTYMHTTREELERRKIKSHWETTRRNKNTRTTKFFFCV